MPYRSAVAPRLADLLMRQGDIAAQQQMDRGRIWGGAVQNIGQQVAGGLGQLAQQKQDASRRAMQDEMAQLELGAARRATAMAPAQDQAAEDAAARTKDLQKAQDLAQAAGAILGASPAEQPQMYGQWRQSIIERQLAPPESIPETYTPGWLRYKQREAMTVLQQMQADEQAAAAAAPKLGTRNPEDDIYDQRTGAVLTPGMARPVEPAKPVELNEGAILVDPTTGKEIARGAPRRFAPQARDTGDPGPLESIIGPDGKVIRVPRREAVGKPPAAGTEKASSGVQKRVLNFFNRAQQADTDLEALEPEIEKLGLVGQTRQALAPNFLQTQLGQSYTAAQRAFTEARLRKDSGAAIPDHEFKSDRQTYFVQPGDSKKTIQDKNRARATMLASLAFESGQALGEFVGDADEARSIVDGYKARAAGQGGKQKIGRFEVVVEP